MDERADLRERGRSAYLERRWADAFELLSAADREAPLGPDDLELLVTSAYLVGRDDVGDDLATRAYRELVRDEPTRAARHAFWLGVHLLLRGEPVRSGGWLARARRVLDDEIGRDCVEQGYLLVPAALQRLGEGDAEGARADDPGAPQRRRAFAACPTNDA